MVEYNKVYKKKDGRILVASGPRASQDRQKLQKIEPPVMNSPEMKSLREDIQKLTSTIPTNTSGYSKYQVDELVNTAIEEVSIDLEKKYILEINELKENNTKLEVDTEKLNSKLDKKDDIILKLTTNRPVDLNYADSDSSSDSDRPSIENIFIDPTTKGKEEVFDSHITNKEIESSTSKVRSNVDKLKKLMNK